MVNGEQQLQTLVGGKKIIETEATIRRDLQLEDANGVDSQQEQGEGSAIPTAPQHTPTITQPSSSQSQKKHKPRKPKKKDTQIPQSSVPSDNLADEAINEENVSKHSNDPLLSGEDRLKLEELMALCTNLQNGVLDLEHTKTTQALEIDSLKRRVKKLEKKQRSKTHGLKRLYKGRKIHDIDADEDITLENVHDAEMFDVNDLDGDEVVVENEVADKDVNLSVDEVTLAQALTALKSAKLQEKGDVIKEPSVPVSAASTKVSTIIPTTDATTITDVSSIAKAKGIVFHEQEKEQEQAPTLIVSSQQPSQIKVQDKGYKLNKKKKKKKGLLEKNLNKLKKPIQLGMIFRLKLKLIISRLKDCMMKNKTKRAKDKRNKPPTQAQQRKLYTTYLKNMEGYTLKQLKGFKFEVIKDMFDRAFKRVNTFVDHEKELIEESSKKGKNEKESSSKRTGEELESDKSKKQKLDEKVEAEVDDAKEAEELKQCLEIVPDNGDDVTVDATPLSFKMPIVDYKIYQEGKKSFFQIIRADGNSQMYLTFTKMLKNFDREDLEVLWRIVKAIFKKTKPVNYMDTFLHLNLKTMFEHHLEDNVWKNQQGLVKVLNWKLYDFCEVHCVTMQNILYYLLVEKMYPLTNHTLHQMFNDVKLQVDYECKMAFELLRLVKKQLKEGYGRIVGIKSLFEVTAAKVERIENKAKTLLASGVHAQKLIQESKWSVPLSRTNFVSANLVTTRGTAIKISCRSDKKIGDNT
ncbi:hypothetical protein Tco_0764549 [Tanacetum coccineum]